VLKKKEGSEIDEKPLSSLPSITEKDQEGSE
jgi:hypothetical protein